MKKLYTVTIAILITAMTFAQGYKLGVVHITGDNFKIVAIPDFDSTGNVDFSDISFSMMMPQGSSEIINEVSLMGGRPWTITKIPAASLTAAGLGDGTKDLISFVLEVGQTFVSHVIGDEINLVSFNISNLPTTGLFYFILNTDAIAVNAPGGVFYSAINADIDSTDSITDIQDYYDGTDSTYENIDFSTLSTNDLALVNFNYYPNPIEGILHVNAQEEITQISIYNMLGQEVKRILPSSLSIEIDMSNLANGAYFIKAQVGVHTGTFKIIKK